MLTVSRKFASLFVASMLIGSNINASNPQITPAEIIQPQAIENQPQPIALPANIIYHDGIPVSPGNRVERFIIQNLIPKAKNILPIAAATGTLAGLLYYAKNNDNATFTEIRNIALGTAVLAAQLQGMLYWGLVIIND